MLYYKKRYENVSICYIFYQNTRNYIQFKSWQLLIFNKFIYLYCIKMQTMYIYLFLIASQTKISYINKNRNEKNQVSYSL